MENTHKIINLDETNKFFWRSDASPWSPPIDAMWTPYEEGDNQFLEKHFQQYLNGKSDTVTLGNPPEYIILKIGFKLK